MKYFFISKQSKYNFIIPTLLLIGSFSLYAYNLEGQPPHGDEVLYLSWGSVFFDTLKEGDLNNPCLKNLRDCELLFTPGGKFGGGWQLSYTPLRNFFVGFGQYLTTGENQGDFYEWSCKWASCWDDEYIPSREELSSGRFFSPIFGSLTIVLAFFVGKTLFNRTTGLFFSLMLLFLSLWVVNSRLMMSEVYLHFFLLLTMFCLLKSFKKENNHRKLFFILGGISLGIAFNIKVIAMEMIIPILILILFYGSFNEKFHFKFFKNRKNLFKVISLVLIFFMITSITFVATVPRYQEDPLNQILKIKDEASFGFASMPTVEKNYFFRSLITLQTTLLPYLVDAYLYDIFLDEVLKSPTLNQRLGDPQNYSTIPLTLFFFIGLIYMIRKIKTRNLNFSEFVLLVWFASLFIFMTLFVDRFTIERYYLSIMFPVMLIASYALWNFIKQIKNQKEKILFFMAFITAHSIFLVSHLSEIYFSTETWGGSRFISSQYSLNDPLVYVSSIIFVIIFVIILLRNKTHFVEGRLVIKKLSNSE